MMVMSTLGVEADDGHELGLWLSGHVIYGCCVFVANIVLFLKFNIHHGYSMFVFFLMILAYFFFFFLESLFLAFPQIYLLFVQTFSQPLSWLCLAFSILLSSAFELAIKFQ
jgi:hypothetical protein